MTNPLFDDEDQDEVTEKPAGELSEDEARERRYADDAAKKLKNVGALDEPMTRVRRNAAIGAFVAIVVALGGGVVWAAKTRGSEMQAERDILKKPVQPGKIPEGFAFDKPAPVPAPEPLQPDDYDNIDPSIGATPVTQMKPLGEMDCPAEMTAAECAEIQCPAEYTPSQCIEHEKQRLIRKGDPYGAKSHHSYAANVGKETKGSDWEDEGMLAPMGYYGVKHQQPTLTASAAPEMAPMGVPSQAAMSLPPNLKQALEKAAQGSGPRDPDDVKEEFASRPGTLDSEDEERELGMCELTAGQVIHVSNLTAINTDVPAKSSVTAKVGQTVYCGSDNQYVAIPQGSTFTASANARVSYGDERIQLCMEQLRKPPSRDKPNGSMTPVKCWAAADITGMVGWTGEVDNHWDKLIAGVALSTFLSLGTTSVAGNQEGFAPTIAQRAASQAGMQMNQAGQRIVQRDLARKPTITRKMQQSGTVVITTNQQMQPWKALKAMRRGW